MMWLCDCTSYYHKVIELLNNEDTEQLTRDLGFSENQMWIRGIILALIPSIQRVFVSNLQPTDNS